MATKRPAGEDSPPPPAKRLNLAQTQLPILPATSQEDLDIKVLQVKLFILAKTGQSYPPCLLVDSKQEAL